MPSACLLLNAEGELLPCAVRTHYILQRCFERGWLRVTTPATDLDTFMYDTIPYDDCSRSQVSPEIKIARDFMLCY